MTQIKLTEQKRRDVIIKAAKRVKRDYGELFVTHGAVAKRCDVPTSSATVRHYFPTKADLVDACDLGDE